VQAALHSVAVLKDLQACPEYLNSKRSGRNLRMTEAQRMLLEICLPKEQFVIVLDGLDECAEQLDGLEARQHLMQFLNLAAKDARTLVASRHLADIDSSLCCTQCEVRAPEANLRDYVVERLAGLEKRMSSAKSLTPAVIDKVVKDADGM
jgi:ABC-type transport system involved in cytochrome bd biosynthesis fused ATPase/permease subunit